jgi:glycerophosphoryl diester phosphodiesterase
MLLAGEPLIVAHRGASFDAPENTRAAFLLAWQQGADAIEGDFYPTTDRRLVCIHDATTKRTADRNLVVTNSTLAALRALDVGSWKDPRWAGEKIPTLEEVLALVPAGKKIFIELKGGRNSVLPLKEALDKSALTADQTVVIAFDAQVIAAVKKQIPAIKAYWLTAFKRQDPKDPKSEWKPARAEILATLKRIQADGLDCEAHEQADEQLAAALRQAGLPLHVWTVDKPEVAVKFVKLGAASITTNRPQYLRDQLKQAAQTPAN